MSTDLNKVIQIGRLTKDVDYSTLQSGTKMAKFTIAVNESYTVNGEKREEVSYFDCIAWAKLADLMAQYCKKGSKVAVEGKLKQDRWKNDEGQGRSKVTIVTSNVQFLTAKSEQSEQQEQPVIENNPFSDSSIPF